MKFFQLIEMLNVKTRVCVANHKHFNEDGFREYSHPLTDAQKLAYYGWEVVDWKPRMDEFKCVAYAVIMPPEVW